LHRGAPVAERRAVSVVGVGAGVELDAQRVAQIKHAGALDHPVLDVVERQSSPELCVPVDALEVASLLLGRRSAPSGGSPGHDEAGERLRGDHRLLLPFLRPSAVDHDPDAAADEHGDRPHDTECDEHPRLRPARGGGSVGSGEVGIPGPYGRPAGGPSAPAGLAGLVCVVPRMLPGSLSSVKGALVSAARCRRRPLVAVSEYATGVVSRPPVR
jgi:hypothetical protein